MVAIQKHAPAVPVDHCQRTALSWIGLIFFSLAVYVAMTVQDVAPTAPPPEGRRQVLTRNLRHAIVEKRHELIRALESLRQGAHGTAEIPVVRLQRLRDHHQVVGERLKDIQAGTETVHEVLGTTTKGSGSSDEPPMTIDEILSYLDGWIHQLHDALQPVRQENFLEIWKAYHDLTVRTLFPWDQDYLSRMPERREDGSIFLSLASYRDENCFNTLNWAYGNATHPERLFTGLVQQNCVNNCRTGVLVGGRMEETEPDMDCHKEFCKANPSWCGNIRALFIDEDESLGPYAARFFASKLWYGETWYLQIDAHMTFLKNWDAISIQMLKEAPTAKPVLSHYPPGDKANLAKLENKPTERLCGPVFAGSEIESQIVRLEGSDVYDKVHLKTPRFAPFTAAGYMVAHSSFLREVPFDPFLPWIFMGEEIIMSSRLWTAGYDIFSPPQAVLGHMYVRRHKPKFWESIDRALHSGVANNIKELVLNRIKYQLTYPESAKDMLPKNLLTAVEYYSMGTARPLHEYLRIIGMNMTRKEIHKTDWCQNGTPPPGMEQYDSLYYDEGEV